MATSRFLRTALRSRTITGTTTVGGSSSTTVSVHQDGTVSFNDRNGNTHRIHVPANYTTADQDKLQPTTKAVRGDKANALYALIDALIART